MVLCCKTITNTTYYVVIDQVTNPNIKRTLTFTEISFQKTIV